MNLASILLKKIIEQNDADTWSNLQREYLPSEYSKVYDAIERIFEHDSALPSFEILTLAVREESTKNKLIAIEKTEDIDAEASQLLNYLINEYVQSEIMTELDNYIDTSVAIDNAEESISNLQEIVLRVENKVDLKTPDNDMRRMTLFASEEELAKNLPLGLNKEYDEFIQFSPRDLILIGGKRGAGKSLTCTNIAANIYDTDRSVIYFTIEMDARSIMQRVCAISTNVPMSRIQYNNVSIDDAYRIARWWSSRFENGEEAYTEYLKHKTFSKLHEQLSKGPLKSTQLDIVYDPILTLSKIRNEIDKKVSVIKPKAIIVDYINQVKRGVGPSYGKHGQYDWTEQIEVSKALKGMAQHYEVPVIVPYQIDATGEARFAKGILDSADAAYTLDPHSQMDNCVTFNCVKMRNAKVEGFTSKMDWNTLKIGPESAQNPRMKLDDDEEKPKEAVNDV